MRRHRLATTSAVLLLPAAMVMMSAAGSARAGPLVDGRAPAQQSSVEEAAAHPGGAVRPVPGRVLRPFDPPANPYGPGHRGVDLAAQAGDQVVAALAGTIVFAGEVARVGWVTVDHGGGLATTYGPLQQRTNIGTAVHAGQPLGRLGGPDGDPLTHLDWGARLHGDYIDPMSLLQRWHLRLTAVSP